jgi:hypothetical protein
MYKYVVYDGRSLDENVNDIIFSGNDIEQARGIADHYGGIVYKYDYNDTNLIDGEIVYVFGAVAQA